MEIYKPTTYGWSLDKSKELSTLIDDYPDLSSFYFQKINMYKDHLDVVFVEERSILPFLDAKRGEFEPFIETLPTTTTDLSVVSVGALESNWLFYILRGASENADDADRLSLYLTRVPEFGTSGTCH